MKKIKKNTSKGAQSISAYQSLCGCDTCQDCRDSSTAVALWNAAGSNNLHGRDYLYG